MTERKMISWVFRDEGTTVTLGKQDASFKPGGRQLSCTCALCTWTVLMLYLILYISLCSNVHAHFPGTLRFKEGDLVQALYDIWQDGVIMKCATDSESSAMLGGKEESFLYID
jgi:hypothetical protein